MADLYGLIGKNIAYSRSPELFGNFFKKHRINAEYRLFDLSSVEEIGQVLQLPRLKGVNITIPYKQVILRFLDRISLEAEQIGAVNTVKIEGGKKIGFNTDAYGFEQTLLTHKESFHRQALILGDGATAKTVRYVLDKLGISFLNVSRTGKPHTITYDRITPRLLQEYLLIINTTPLGNLNHPGQKPRLPYEALTPRHFLIDLNYNPPLTPFLEEGLKNNAKAVNGEKMLELQALKALEIWTERSFPPK